VSNDFEPTRSAETGRLLPLLRCGWKALVLGIVAGIVVSAIIVKLTPKQYSASAKVEVTVTGVVGGTATVANSRTSGPINLDTEAQLAASRVAANEVKQIDKKTKNTSTTKLLKGLTVSVPANTEVLTLTYQSSSRTRAAELANDFAQAYINNRTASAEAFIKAELAVETSLYTTANTELTKWEAKIEHLPKKSPLKASYTTHKQLELSTVKSTQTAIHNLGSPVNPSLIISRAVPAAKASSPSKLIYLAGGLVVGLLLGLLGAWFSYAKLRRVTTRADVVEGMHLPLTGVIRHRPLRRSAAAELRVVNQYRWLAQRVRAAWGAPGVIVVAGIDRGAPAKRVAANLAAALAETGTSVALLCFGEPAPTADPRLAGDTTVKILGGPDAKGTAVQFSREQAVALRGNGYLVIAASDLVGRPDAQALATSGDVVLAVVRKHTRMRVARAGLAELDAVAAPVLGAVLVPHGAHSLDHREVASTSSAPLSSTAATAVTPPAAGPSDAAHESGRDLMADMVDASDHLADDPDHDPDPVPDRRTADRAEAAGPAGCAGAADRADATGRITPDRRGDEHANPNERDRNLTESLEPVASQRDAGGSTPRPR
jgi:capsular polysaccharide biosynthesis protein